MARSGRHRRSRTCSRSSGRPTGRSARSAGQSWRRCPILERGHEALVGLVQRAVFGELQHADLVGSACGGRAALAGRGALCGGAAAATSQGTRGKQARSKGDEIPARDAQHGDQLRFLCSGLRSRGEALYREKSMQGDILARSHNRHHNVNAVLTSGQRLNPPWFEDRYSIEVGARIYGRPAFRDRGTGQNAIARTYWRISAGILYTLYHTQRSPRGHLRPAFVRRETQTRDFTREMQSPLLCFVLAYQPDARTRSCPRCGGAAGRRGCCPHP